MDLGRSLSGHLERVRQYGPGLLHGRGRLGWCPICEQRTLFVNTGGHPRNALRCVRCNSVPKRRALVRVLEAQFPNWRLRRIHESSPGGPASRKLRREAMHYSSGSYPDEDLEHLPYRDNCFEIFVTQDVLEHVFDTDAAFAEIARVLRPGGVHVFTVPYWPDRRTVLRVTRTPSGLRHLKEPVYHQDPGNPQGVLVVRDWGEDLVESVRAASGLTTEVVDTADRHLGIEGTMKEVFVTAKPG